MVDSYFACVVQGAHHAGDLDGCIDGAGRDAVFLPERLSNYRSELFHNGPKVTGDNVVPKVPGNFNDEEAIISSLCQGDE